MQEKKHPRSLARILLALLIAIIAGGVVYWNFYKYKLVKTTLHDVVYKKSNGLYSIHYDHIALDEVGGNLRITNLTITPDTTLFRQMIEQKRNPPRVISVHIPELLIEGVKTPKALLNQKIEGRKVAIKDPVIGFYYANPGDTLSRHDPQELYEQLSGSIQLIRLDTVELSHASISFVNFQDRRTSLEGSDISVTLRGVWIDSLHLKDSSRFFFSDNTDTRLSKMLIHDKKGIYDYRFEEAHFNSGSRSLSIGKCRIEPLLGESAFARLMKVQKDRYNFTMSGMAFSGLNLQKIMAASLVADTLLIDQSSYKVYHDLSYPRSGESRVGHYPQQELLKAPLPVYFRRIVFRDAFIEYKEKNAKSENSGEVQFSRVRAWIGPVTNIRDSIRKDPAMVLDFSARFLDKAPVHALITMQLGDPGGRFRVDGSLGAMDAAWLNPLLTPMALAKVEKGHITKLIFSLRCSNTSSEGRLVFLYEDLKLSLLKKDGEETDGNGKPVLKKKKLAGLLAGLFITKENPGKNKQPKEVDINYSRDPQRSFFNLIWKSIFTGVKQTVMK